MTFVKIKTTENVLKGLTEMASKRGLTIDEFLTFQLANLVVTDKTKNPVGRPPKPAGQTSATTFVSAPIHYCYRCGEPLTKSAFGWTDDGIDNPNARWIHASCSESLIIEKTRPPKKLAPKPQAAPRLPVPMEVPMGQGSKCAACSKNISATRHAIGLLDSKVSSSMAPGQKDWVHVDCLDGNPPDLIAIVVDRARQVIFEEAKENYAAAAERWLIAAYAWDVENPEDIIDKSEVLDGLAAIGQKESVLALLAELFDKGSRSKNVGPVTRPNVTGHSHMPLPHSSPSEGHTVTSPNLIAALSVMQVGRGNICRGCDARITPGQEYAVCEDCTHALDEYIGTGAKVNLLAFRTFCIERRWRTSEQVE